MSTTYSRSIEDCNDFMNVGARLMYEHAAQDIEQCPASKETEESKRTDNPRVPSWRSLLTDAIRTPGLVHEAYRRFHGYSLRNQLLALHQCVQRNISPGPLATFKHWQRLGRHVLRGQQGLTLCMPINRGTAAASREDETEDEATPSARTVFVHRRHWFVLSQTDGAPYECVDIPAWSEAAALQHLGIARVRFDELNGNVQGYSVGRSVSVSPIAALPHKTLFHELGHVILGHTQDDCKVPRRVQELEAESVALLCLDSLGLPGAAFARGYVQSWATTDDLTEEVATRIITAADAILRAGHAVA